MMQTIHDDVDDTDDVDDIDDTDAITLRDKNNIEVIHEDVGGKKCALSSFSIL